jgi:hypothetical protein
MEMNAMGLEGWGGGRAVVEIISYAKERLWFATFFERENYIAKKY